jgi:hypothetical protein
VIRRVLIWLEARRVRRKYRQASEQLAYIVRMLEDNRTVREHVRRALFNDPHVKVVQRGRR